LAFVVLCSACLVVKFDGIAIRCPAAIFGVTMLALIWSHLTITRLFKKNHRWNIDGKQYFICY